VNYDVDVIFEDSTVRVHKHCNQLKPRQDSLPSDDDSTWLLMDVFELPDASAEMAKNTPTVKTVPQKQPRKLPTASSPRRGTRVRRPPQRYMANHLLVKANVNRDKVPPTQRRGDEMSSTMWNFRVQSPDRAQVSK
jgi:hypothetical protein